jgi:hypothetical protein
VEEWQTLEQHWYTLLFEDKEPLTHWFQEIGFMILCIQANLQTLSKTTLEAVEPGLPRQGVMHSFKTEYPVIFAALDAKFCLTHSNSQISKQMHGALCDSLKEGVSYAFTDAQWLFMVNIEYHYWEARQKLIRGRDLSKEDTKSGLKKHNTAYSGIKDNCLK